MDQLCASGELVWVGAGALGRNSGRVALYFREDLRRCSARRRFKGAVPRRTAPHMPLSASGSRAGACFFTDLLVDVELAPEELQEALWDLVWAGEATNDAFAPLRAPRLTLARAQRERGRTARRAGPVRGRRRRGGARRAGPGPLVADRSRCSASDVDPVARRRALGELLLERYGILTREQVLAEGIPGGFSAIYSELSQLETLGVARRGYFVEGLGGAQFALPGAVERLRALPRRRRAADRARGRRPGAALRRGAAVAARGDEGRGAGRAWPAPTWCSSGGEPVLYLERGGRGLQTLVARRRCAARAGAERRSSSTFAAGGSSGWRSRRSTASRR